MQGIGWLGMSEDQINAAGGKGVFTQRVWAQRHSVGCEPGSNYHYWHDH